MTIDELNEKQSAPRLPSVDLSEIKTLDDVRRSLCALMMSHDYGETVTAEENDFLYADISLKEYCEVCRLNFSGGDWKSIAKDEGLEGMDAAEILGWLLEYKEDHVATPEYCAGLVMDKCELVLRREIMEV